MKYSITQLSNISGINKITLRSWEERHGFWLLKELIQIFENILLKQLLCAINTSVLISEGLKISVISKKSVDQISSLIDSKFHSKDKVSRSFCCSNY